MIGLSATMAQDIVPAAATLSPEAHLGKVVGTVMTGLLLGILLSRVVSGFVAEHGALLRSRPTSGGVRAPCAAPRSRRGCCLSASARSGPRWPYRLVGHSAPKDSDDDIRWR